MLFYISIFFLFIYAYYIVIFLKSMPFQCKEIKVYAEKVSIVCSARNEERNIKSLLEAIIHQNYDLNLVQLIIIDDASTDRTLEILKEEQTKFPDFMILSSSGREESLSPKKNALSQAMKHVKYDIILSLDADCIPEKNWINAMVDTYIKFPETDMLVGFSQTDTQKIYQKAREERKSIFSLCKISQIFEYFDFLVLMFATSGSIHTKRYFSCSGQNLSFRKSSFESVGGYTKILHLISGDDLHLMQLFRKNNKVIKFAHHTEARVETRSCESMVKLINQRSRWASNMKYMLISNPEFFIYLLSVFFVLTLIPLLLFLDLWYALILIIMKLSIDAVFINMSYRKFYLGEQELKCNNFVNKLNLLSSFIFWSFFQVFYVLLVSIFGAFSLFVWKDRRGYKS